MIGCLSETTTCVVAKPLVSNKVNTKAGTNYNAIGSQDSFYFKKGESPAAPLCRGGGVVVTTYLELLSSNLVIKSHLGADLIF